jgi:hypothetical protein
MCRVWATTSCPPASSFWSVHRLCLQPGGTGTAVTVVPPLRCSPVIDDAAFADGPAGSVDWTTLSGRAAFASHQLVGWTYWDPVAIERYTALGVPDGVGFYVASRAAPLLPAGHQAVTAAFGTIHAGFIEACVSTALAHTTAEAIFAARCEAIAEGLRTHVPDICDGLAGFAAPLWEVVDALPATGRVLFATHRQAPRPATDDALSAWLAVNCIREWRGDTHFAVLVSVGIGPVAAGVLDDARRNYGGWIPRSRGADDVAIAAALDELAARGLADSDGVNAAGRAFRDEIELRTDQLTDRPWRLLGEDTTRSLLDLIEPVGDRLVARIDATAGPEWMPAARRPRS